MQVFLSWSGVRSKAVAEALGFWLRKVIQAVDPWISSDIEKGTRWSPEIASRLEQSKIGIVCLTQESLDARWILFEAGALSKTADAYVCTLLLDLAPTDVQQPLGQFQHTTRSESDMRQLLLTVNAAVAKSGERALSESLLAEMFDDNWPRLKDRLDAIANQPVVAHPARRTEKEMLEEVLGILREQERRSGTLYLTEQESNPLTLLVGRRGLGKSSLIKNYYRAIEPSVSDLTSGELQLLAELARTRESRRVGAQDGGRDRDASDCKPEP